MRLTEGQVEALRAALLSSFPSYEALDRFATDEKLVKISLEANVGHKGADLETVVFELLNHVKSEQDEGGLASSVLPGPLASPGSPPRQSCCTRAASICASSKPSGTRSCCAPASA